MERVKNLKEKSLIKKEAKKLKEYENSRSELAERWFLINILDLSKEELQALDYLIHKKTLKFLLFFGITYLPLAYFGSFVEDDGWPILRFWRSRRYIRKQMAKTEEIADAN